MQSIILINSGLSIPQLSSGTAKCTVVVCGVAVKGLKIDI